MLSFISEISFENLGWGSWIHGHVTTAWSMGFVGKGSGQCLFPLGQLCLGGQLWGEGRCPFTVIMCSRFPIMGHISIYSPALVTGPLFTPKLHSYPIYIPQLHLMCAEKPPYVLIEPIFKDSTIPCSSAQRILLLYSLVPWSSRCFRLGLPIMSQGTKQMTPCAWYSVHWGKQIRLYRSLGE